MVRRSAVALVVVVAIALLVAGGLRWVVMRTVDGFTARAVGTWHCSAPGTGSSFDVRVDANHSFLIHDTSTFPANDQSDDDYRDPDLLGTWLVQGSQLRVWASGRTLFVIGGVSSHDGVHELTLDAADPDFGAAHAFAVRAQVVSGRVLFSDPRTHGSTWTCRHTSTRSPKLKPPSSLTPPPSARDAALSDEAHGRSDLRLSGAINATIHTTARCDDTHGQGPLGASIGEVSGATAVPLGSSQLDVELSPGSGNASVTLESGNGQHDETWGPSGQGSYSTGKYWVAVHDMLLAPYSGTTQTLTIDGRLTCPADFKR